MNLAIFGGTGLTGKELTLQALDRGHNVSLLVQDPSKVTFEHPNLTLFQGDLLKPESFSSIFVEKEAVVSCLGLPSWKEKDSKIFSVGTANLVDAMQRYQIKRFLCVTSRESCPYKKKYQNSFMGFFLNMFFQCVFDDLQKTEQLVMKSELDWTILRPPKLLDEPRSGDVRVEKNNFFLPKGETLNRADLAAFILKCLEDPQTIHQALAVAN